MKVKVQNDCSIRIGGIKTPGELLKLLMLNKNLTTYQVAKESGIINWHIDKILKEKVRMTKQTSEKLGNALKINKNIMYKLQLLQDMHKIVLEIIRVNKDIKEGEKSDV